MSGEAGIQDLAVSSAPVPGKPGSDSPGRAARERHLPEIRARLDSPDVPALGTV